MELVEVEGLVVFGWVLVFTPLCLDVARSIQRITDSIHIKITYQLGFQKLWNVNDDAGDNDR